MTDRKGGGLSNIWVMIIGAGQSTNPYLHGLDMDWICPYIVNDMDIGIKHVLYIDHARAIAIKRS